MKRAKKIKINPRKLMIPHFLIVIKDKSGQN